MKKTIIVILLSLIITISGFAQNRSGLLESNDLYIIDSALYILPKQNYIPKEGKKAVVIQPPAGAYFVPVAFADTLLNIELGKVYGDKTMELLARLRNATGIQGAITQKNK